MSSLSETPIGPVLPKAPTGNRGLDEITGGGLPRGRSTLVTGGTGCGKTLLGLQFLVAGAREHGEPGVLVTFEESAGEVAANVASLGFDLDELRRDGLLAVYAFRAEPTEVAGTGEFDFEPLFVLLDAAITRNGARRVVLDTIEALFGAFQAPAIVRNELARLFGWLKEREVTAVVTGERGDNGALTRHGIEEYVSDCVIALDHRIHNQVSTRWLRVVKYRGSGHATNEYPFLITGRGFSVPPVTAVTLDYDAPRERISTGVPRLDQMLCGGLLRGAAVLVSGAAGTGKTTLGAYLIDAACARGERALLILFEESPGQVVRNMGSVGLDLGRWVQAGLLRVWAVRSAELGLDNHLAMVSGLVAEHAPAVAVVDGIGSLLVGHARGPAGLMLARKFHLFKARGITAMATVLADPDTETAMGASSQADTWLMLRNVESGGKRHRLLFVLKSRGTAHSDEVQEFVLTDHGIELVDVYAGPGAVMTGSARLAQADRERRDQLPELERMADHDERPAAQAQASRRGMGARRRADPDADDDDDDDDDEEQR
jgi:circadian clock protein KaiC